MNRASGRGRCSSSTGDRRYRSRREREEQNKRAQSEPTSSVCPANDAVDANDTTSLIEQAMAKFHSSDPEDFPLVISFFFSLPRFEWVQFRVELISSFRRRQVDEDIPDFVMEYLQSDQGHLDQDIPDHILDFIHTRAAALERNRNRQVILHILNWILHIQIQFIEMNLL